MSSDLIMYLTPFFSLILLERVNIIAASVKISKQEMHGVDIDEYNW